MVVSGVGVGVVVGVGDGVGAAWVVAEVVAPVGKQSHVLGDHLIGIARRWC